MRDIKIFEIRNPVLVVLILSIFVVMFSVGLMDKRQQTRDLEIAFSGTVLKKGMIIDDDDYPPEFHFYLIIETPEGKKVRRYCHRTGYAECRVGDLVVKEAGRENYVHPANRKSFKQLLDEDFPRDAHTEQMKEMLRRMNSL